MQLPDRRTPHERVILAGLNAHTRLHAIALLAEHPGLRVTSGRRTVVRNRIVGGSPRSWHLVGRAVDFAASTAVLDQALLTARAQRVSPNCTGPEEAIHEKRGQRGAHLHVAW